MPKQDNRSAPDGATPTPQTCADAMAVTAHLLHHAARNPRGATDGDVAEAWNRIMVTLGLGLDPAVFAIVLDGDGEASS